VLGLLFSIYTPEERLLGLKAMSQITARPKASPGEATPTMKRRLPFTLLPQIKSRNLFAPAEIVVRHRAERLLFCLLAMSEGASKNHACKLAGLSYVTAWRWRKAFAENGWEGLKPQTWRCGRKAKAVK
jgi:hypothetical protein